VGLDYLRLGLGQLHLKEWDMLAAIIKGVDDLWNVSLLAEKAG
jgi:hypothetical protein